MTAPNDRNPEITDRSLEAIAHRLDALGLSEQDAPDGLEDRVLAALTEAVAPAPIALRTEAPWWRSGAVRMAASVVLLGSVGATVYVAQRGASTNPGGSTLTAVAAVEDRIEGMFAISELTDAGAFDDSIASLDLWVDTLDAEATGGWQSSGLTDDWFGEGAL